MPWKWLRNRLWRGMTCGSSRFSASGIYWLACKSHLLSNCTMPSLRGTTTAWCLTCAREVNCSITFKNSRISLLTKQKFFLLRCYKLSRSFTRKRSFIEIWSRKTFWLTSEAIWSLQTLASAKSIFQKKTSRLVLWAVLSIWARRSCPVIFMATLLTTIPLEYCFSKWLLGCLPITARTRSRCIKTSGRSPPKYQQSLART